MLLLLELTINAPREGDDIGSAFTHTCHLVYSMFNYVPYFALLCISVGQLFIFLFKQVHNVCHRVSFQFNTSSYDLFLKCFRNIIEYFFAQAGSSSNFTGFKTVMECLESIRFVY